MFCSGPLSIFVDCLLHASRSDPIVSGTGYEKGDISFLKGSFKKTNIETYLEIVRCNKKRLPELIKSKNSEQIVQISLQDGIRTCKIISIGIHEQSGNIDLQTLDMKAKKTFFDVF